MYGIYPSTFQRPLEWLRSVDPPTDPTAVEKVRPIVVKLLAERLHEETDGQGAFRKDMARKRIAGVIEKLDHLRALACQERACPEFLALVDLVLADAREAHARAPAAASAPIAETPADDTPPAAAWTQREVVRTTAYDLLPDEFKDI